MDSTEVRRRSDRSAEKAGVDTNAGAETQTHKLGDTERGTRSSKGLCTYIIVLTAGVIVLLGIIIALLPCPIEPVAFSLPPPPVWTGALTPNDKLQQAERLFENALIGPESIVSKGEYMYTGTLDGRIVSIHNGKQRTLARLGKGKNCGSFQSEPTCGRPLGMRLDKDGDLLVADAYLGIFRVQVTTGTVHQLLSSHDQLAGTRPKFLNDIEEGSDRTIYFTDTSTRWDRRHNRYCILEGEASGRLLSYNPFTLDVKELVGGLAFANGVAISYDESHILVAETTKARILRYHLTGPNQGKTEIFANNLPGLPDNIRRSGRGTYWVGMATVRRSGKMSLIDLVAPYPWMRRLLTKLLSQETLISLIPKYGLVVELNQDGEIVDTLHDATGTHVPSVSEVEESDGVLHMGSYQLPFLSRVNLDKK